MGGFVELRSHSAFSFGDGAVGPEALVRRAAELGYEALGLTDHADLGGAIRFALEAELAGVRPVVGAELVVDGHPAAFLAMSRTGFRNLASLVTRSRMGDWSAWAAAKGELEARAGTSPYTRDLRSRSRATAVTPRARPEDGRFPARKAGRGGRAGGPGERPLAPSPPRDGGRAGSRTNAPHPLTPSPPRQSPPHPLTPSPPRESPPRPLSPSPPRDGVVPGRGRPRLTFADLVDRSEGLYVLTGGPGGEVASLLRSQRPEEASYILSRWEELFPGRLALEAQLHHVSGEESALAESLVELAARHDLPWVVSNDPRYLDGSSRLVHDLLTALRAGLDVNTAASWGVLHPNGEWRLKSPEEMAVQWRGREEGLERSAEIAASCGFDLAWLRPPLPSFPVPDDHDDDTWLRELTFRGAAERWGDIDERQRTQLDHELGVIRRLSFAGFFLVMWDAVRFARERGILCQGRGSAANSAVAYCLGITAVDPVRHGLLFERFLSEVRTDGRAEAPDIDVDFEMHRREEVLDYMYSHYGRAHAAITAVTQVFHAPTAIQDCMRALGYPAEQAFVMSKRLHHAEPSDGADALEQGLAKMAGVDLEEPRGRALLSALRALDDVPRLRSTHPGGFVLSAEPLGDYMPIEETSMGRTILQFDKDDLDAAGVPKFDFLGLGGLSVIHIAFDAIHERTGERLELYTLPVDDPRTYEMIGRGDTVGTFQIESRAQIQSIVQTTPERLYDIVVQVALIRPGPIQARFVQPYTRRRRGLEEVVYDDPRLEPITRRTYGIPIFQEQAMAISMALGGFSAAEADELRRAMGHMKKMPKLHAALQRLKTRMSQNGVAPETAEHIVEDLYSFANYGFPESHAWSFALIAYATAYLKAHYPAEFFMGLLNAWPMGFYPPATLVHQARRDGVTVLPPCLRDGGWECSLCERENGEGERGREGEGENSEGVRGRGGEGAKSEGVRGREGEGAMVGAGVVVGEWVVRYEAGSAGERASRVARSGREGDPEGGGVREVELPPNSHGRGRDSRREAGGARNADARREGCGAGTGVRRDAGGDGRESGPGGASDQAASGARPGPADRPVADGPARATNPPDPAPTTHARRHGGEPPALRIGWKHIRGLGERAQEALQHAREAGSFTSVEDVVRRAELTRAEALHLARAGAFEAFEPGRRRATWEALRAAGDTLPLAPARKLPFDPAELRDEELIFLDYLATGICTHGHPMEHLRPRLDDAGVAHSATLATLDDGAPVVVAGLVVARQHPATAKGVVFMLLEDEHGFINAVIMPPVYKKNQETINTSPFLLIEGRLEHDGAARNVLARRFRRLRTGPIQASSHDYH